MTDPVTPVEVTITPRDNGSYRVTGPVVILDAEGRRFERPAGKAVFLCRCGQSATKPFCDGTHSRIGFESVVRAPAPPETDPASEDR
jgi:CDGSH iron-sulfur domain-containing protein 3